MYGFQIQASRLLLARAPLKLIHFILVLADFFVNFFLLRHRQKSRIHQLVFQLLNIVDQGFNAFEWCSEHFLLTICTDTVILGQFSEYLTGYGQKARKPR